MPYTITDPEPYVLAQVFAYQYTNNLLANDRDLRDSLDTEHDYTDGSHDTPKVPDVVGVFSWDGTAVAEVWSVGCDAVAPISRSAMGKWQILFAAAFTTQDFTCKVGGAGVYESGATSELTNPPIPTWSYVGVDKDKILIDIEDDAGAAKDPHYLSVAVQGA